MENFRDRWLARKNGILTQINDQWLKGCTSANKRDVGDRISKSNAKVEEIDQSDLTSLLRLVSKRTSRRDRGSELAAT